MFKNGDTPKPSIHSKYANDCACGGYLRLIDQASDTWECDGRDGQDEKHRWQRTDGQWQQIERPGYSQAHDLIAQLLVSVEQETGLAITAIADKLGISRSILKSRDAAETSMAIDLLTYELERHGTRVPGALQRRIQRLYAA